MESVVTREIISALVGQVPALCIVALLVWLVFKRASESLDRMTNTLEDMRKDLQANTQVGRDNTQAIKSLPENIARMCRFQ